MDSIFKDLIKENKIVVYMDNILVFSSTLQEHHAVMHEVLHRLKQTKLYLKLEKCPFDQPQVEFLGAIVSEGCIKMAKGKLDVINNMQRPRNLTELRSFVQFCNFYRAFISDYADITKPFNELTELNKPFFWDDRTQRAFDLLKSRFWDNVVLTYPL